MKNCVKYVLLSFFCILMMPAAVKAAGNDSLKIEKDKVAVSLEIPEGKTETLTSLRLQLLVTLQSGTMAEPSFVFADAVPSTVKDAVVSSAGDNAYLVDLILSGKKDQDIFGGSEYVKLGDVSVQPTSGNFEIKVEIAGSGDSDNQPAVTCVDAGGRSAMTVSLPDAKPITLTQANFPEQDANPEQPDYNAFDKKMKLSTSVRTGEKRVTFTWAKVKGAEGYVLYQYNAKTKKYELMKKIMGENTTAYAKNFAYGYSGSFRIRAFRTKSNGSTVYGKYSSAVKAKVVLAKVKAVSATYQSKSKVALSWNRVSGAKGYQIWRSSKKSDKYNLVKTIKKGKTVSCQNIKHPDGKTYYYKIRAYTTGADGQRVYGSYSDSKLAVPGAPAKLSLKKKSSKQVTLSWKKSARADGYYIYRSSSKNGKYKCIKTVKNVTQAKITGKGAAKYYYKVCAFEKKGSKMQKGVFSPVVKVK